MTTLPLGLVPRVGTDFSGGPRCALGQNRSRHVGQGRAGGEGVGNLFTLIFLRFVLYFLLFVPMVFHMFHGSL